MIRPGETVTAHAIRLIREEERELCAQEAQSYITLNTGDLSLARLVADKIRTREGPLD